MTYEIIDEYKIYENTTKQIIHFDTNKKNDRKLVNQLKRGSGFSGNTPSFFSNNYYESKSNIT